MSAPALLPLAGKRFNRDPHFQRVMAREEWDYLRLQIGFNRDPHFQRVMGARATRLHAARQSFNRDPHFQRVMADPSGLRDHVDQGASIGTLIFRG